MEAAVPITCAFPSEGSIFFEDDYHVLYHVSWVTVGDLLDITTIVQSPVIWDGRTGGFIRDRQVWRLGTISVIRQVYRILDDGYEIVAEGSSQYVDFFQATFPCGPGPRSNFCFYSNCSVSDFVGGIVTCGPRWADVDDTGIVWGNLQPDGSVIPYSGLDMFQWMDVWGNDEDLTSLCTDG